MYEGPSGVRELCKRVRRLGYRDPLFYGQFDHDGAYGDLIMFLEDNPGACEAIVEFIEVYHKEDEEDDDDDDDEA